MISPEGKLLAAIAILPVCADMIEDSQRAGLISPEMNQKHVKNLMYKIRKLDREMMDTAGPVEIQQQIDIQRAFLQWINFNFGEDEGNKE